MPRLAFPDVITSRQKIKTETPKTGNKEKHLLQNIIGNHCISSIEI